MSAQTTTTSTFVAATNVVATKRQLAVRTANSRTATEGERLEAKLYLTRVAWLEARATGDRRKMFAMRQIGQRHAAALAALAAAAAEA